MTTPQLPLYDPGNPLLAETSAQLTTGLLITPGGQRLALTIRTPSATLTVFLQGPDAKKWAAQLTRETQAMSAAGLIIADGTVKP